MDDDDRKCGRNADGRFATGNTGKPVGTRHKTTLAVEALLDGEAEALTRAAIDLALGGDTVALRLCLDRVAPPRKGRTVIFPLPSIATASDVLKGLEALLAAVSEGAVTPDEAATIAQVLEAKRKAIETVEIEARVAKLEERR